MVEAELAKLNRDYDVNKGNYEALVARREAATISREAELSSDAVHLRIIDPPLEPIIPIGPNRPLLVTAVMLGSLALICSLIFLDSQLRPRFTSVQALRTTTGLPVLGGVTYFRTSSEQHVRRLNMQIFFTLVVLFVFMYLMVMLNEAGLLERLMAYLNISSI
jgi:hypothetical protein